jgi:starvation-inducible DNA-binding protein
VPARAEVGHEPQATLLVLIDLSLLGKQLHWSLGGPLVPVLHRHLDEHAAVACGPVEDQAVVSLLVQFLASVTEPTGGRLGRLRALDVVSQQVLIEAVRELEQQLWMTPARLPPGS